MVRELSTTNNMVELVGVDFGMVDLEPVCEAMNGNQHLSQLDFEYCTMKDNMFLVLVQSLPPNLTTLRLLNLPIGGPGWKALGDHFPPKLEDVEIDDCRCMNGGAVRSLLLFASMQSYQARHHGNP